MTPPPDGLDPGRVRLLDYSPQDDAFEGRGLELPILLLMTDRQLRSALEGAHQVDQLPERGPALAFLPASRGFWFGKPFCLSPDPEVTCWPSSPGPDDNPLAWTCVCEGPREEKGPHGEIEIVDENPPCILQVNPPGSGAFKFKCVRVTCTGLCQVVFTWTGNRIEATCACR